MEEKRKEMDRRTIHQKRLAAVATEERKKKGGEAAEAVEESSGAEAVWTTTNEGDERAGRRTCPLDYLVHFSTGRRMKVDATQ